jgi:hypothetical protein
MYQYRASDPNGACICPYGSSSIHIDEDQLAISLVYTNLFQFDCVES